MQNAQNPLQKQKGFKESRGCRGNPSKTRSLRVSPPNGEELQKKEGKPLKIQRIPSKIRRALLCLGLHEQPELLGSHALAMTRGKAELTILNKLIDAKKDLFVQVYPNDAYVAEHGSAAMEKEEMWYVLKANKGAELVYGFNQNITVACVKSAIRKGTIKRYRNHMPVQRMTSFS